MSEEEVNKIIEAYDNVIADLKQENQQLKDKMNFSYHIRNDTTSIPAVVRKANDVELIKKLQQENTQLKERTNKVLKLVNTILDLPEDKFCKYDTYLNSINEISKILKGEK